MSTWITPERTFGTVMTILVLAFFLLMPHPAAAGEHQTAAPTGSSTPTATPTESAPSEEATPTDTYTAKPSDVPSDTPTTTPTATPSPSPSDTPCSQCVTTPPVTAPPHVTNPPTDTALPDSKQTPSDSLLWLVVALAITPLLTIILAPKHSKKGNTH